MTMRCSVRRRWSLLANKVRTALKKSYSSYLAGSFAFPRASQHHSLTHPHARSLFITAPETVIVRGVNEVDSVAAASSKTRPNGSFSTRWSRFIKKRVHGPAMMMIQFISQLSARNPKRTIAAVVLLSLFLLIVGFATNFYMDVDEQTIWTPRLEIRPKQKRGCCVAFFKVLCIFKTRLTVRPSFPQHSRIFQKQ